MQSDIQSSPATSISSYDDSSLNFREIQVGRMYNVMANNKSRILF